MDDHPKIDPPQPATDAPPKVTLMREVRNNFLSGVFVALPIGLTIWIITKFVMAVDAFIKPLIPARLNPETYMPIHLPYGLKITQFPGLGLIVAAIILFILGTLAKNFFGRTILLLGERLLNRVPFVGAVYSFIKQIVGVVAERQDANFTEVCMIEYPRKGLWVMGFVTSPVAGEPAKNLPPGYKNVFIPTTPNPTSGFLLMVDEAEMKILDMTPEEGAKLIISAGMVNGEKTAEGQYGLHLE